MNGFQVPNQNDFYNLETLYWKSTILWNSIFPIGKKNLVPSAISVFFKIVDCNKCSENPYKCTLYVHRTDKDLKKWKKKDDEHEEISYELIKSTTKRAKYLLPSWINTRKLFAFKNNYIYSLPFITFPSTPSRSKIFSLDSFEAPLCDDVIKKRKRVAAIRSEINVSEFISVDRIFFCST